MPKVKTILELEMPDGKIAELPVYDTDTPESLAQALGKNNFDPAKYSNEIQAAISGGGDFGAGLSPEPANDRISQAKRGLEQFRTELANTSDKRQAELLIKKISALENEIKENPNDDPKGRIVDDAKNLLNILPEIETYPGPASLPMWGVQQLGEWGGMNEELNQYQHKVDSLITGLAKEIQGQKGVLSDQDIARAKKIPPGGRALFSKEGRERQLQNFFEGIEAYTGRNLRREIDPEMLKRILQGSGKGNMPPKGGQSTTGEKPRFKVGPDGIPVRVN